jgi:hypothetical protein
MYAIRKLQKAVYLMAVADLQAYLAVRERRKNPQLAITPDETVELAADAARWLFGRERNPDYVFSRSRCVSPRSHCYLWFSFSEQQREWLLQLMEVAGVRLCGSLRQIPAA